MPTSSTSIWAARGAQAISPVSELPAVSEAVTVDAYTQAGATPNTLEEGYDAALNVILGGPRAGAGANGLVIADSGCTIKGPLIRNFEGSGILVTGTGATGIRVEGNFIGVNRDGVTDRGNGTGVYVASASNTAGVRNRRSALRSRRGLSHQVLPGARPDVCPRQRRSFTPTGHDGSRNQRQQDLEVLLHQLLTAARTDTQASGNRDRDRPLDR